MRWIKSLFAKQHGRRQRYKILFILLFLLLFVLPHIVAWITVQQPMKADVDHLKPGAETLVVIVPGYQGLASRMDDVVKVTQEFYKTKNADIFVPQFNGGYVSNASLYHITDRIETKIHERYEKNKYKKIVLVGFSAGAHLIRKAYIWALGYESDRPNPLGVRPRKWVSKVDRLVLLAGMNRGWSLSPKPKHMNALEHLVILVGTTWNQAIGVGTMVKGLMKGAPFVADLRVQWVRLLQDQVDLKPVVQLLGTIDDFVSPEDNKDLLVSDDFIFIPMGGNTNHGRTVRMKDLAESPQSGALRRDAFLKAMNQPVDKLGEEYKNHRPAKRQHPEINEVVFVAHGIRDFGDDWMRVFELAIEKRNGRQSRQVYAFEPVQYDYFPMGAFLVFGKRQQNVRNFMDLYTEALVKYPKAKFHFIGHSNGTYLLGQALEKYKTIKIDRAVLGGSVLPMDFDWLKYTVEGRIHHMRNLVGDSDWVVAIFPRLHELIKEIFGLQDSDFLNIGSAGFRGFRNGVDNLLYEKGRGCTYAAEEAVPELRNLKWLNGQHGTAFDVAHPQKFGAIVDYLLADDVEEIAFSTAYCTHESNPYIDWASKLCWVFWLLIGLILYGIGKLVVHGLSRRGLAANRKGTLWAAYSLIVVGLLFSL